MLRTPPSLSVWVWGAVVAAAAGVGAEPAGLVAVAPQNPWTLRELEAAGAALASYDPESGTAYVVATAAEQRRLQDAGFAVATVEVDVEAGRRRIAALPDLGLYHTGAEAEAELRDLAARFPDDCRLESIGRSLENREIWALKISDAPADNDATEPDVLVMGCHHAREFMSVEVPLHLARSLLEGAATNARLRRLVDERELWVVPIVNVDGHAFQAEFAASPEWSPPGWRKNRRANGDGSYGVDLNRNYSYQWGLDDEGSSPDPSAETYRGTEPFSEPETRAIRALAERQRFVIAITYHSFGRLWLYPWGHTREALTVDHAAFAALADSMVRSNGYRPGNAFLGTIYLTNGECTDFLYGEMTTRKPTQTLAFTPELNSAGEGGFWPPESLIRPTCEAMLPANLFALEVAIGARRPLTPPQPVLTAVQDAAEARRIALDWRQPIDVENPVTHWEVFEIDPSAAIAAAPVVLAASGRAVLGESLPRPRSARIVLEFEAQLAPVWDYAYVEARGTDGDWVRLAGDATRNASPTGRNAGNGITGGVAKRRLVFDLGAVRGDRVDLAVRLDAAPAAPAPARIAAALDVGATWSEERRVLDPHVTVPRYTVVAARPGLFAYGVTAVDADGQKTDSEIFWFAVPVAVALHDVQVERHGDRHALTWAGDVRDATLEVWIRPLDAAEPVPSAAAAWAAGGLERVAVAAVAAARSGRLEWTADAGRSLVVLRVRDAGGDRLAGAWGLESMLRTRIVGVRPNPFRPGGGIDLEIATTGRVGLDIHAADGRRVRTLFAAPRAAGRAHLVWDGRDAAACPVASGVYFVRLRHAGATHVQRLVLLR
jgi:hypothetical protein